MKFEFCTDMKKMLTTIHKNRYIARAQVFCAGFDDLMCLADKPPQKTGGFFVSVCVVSLFMSELRGRPQGLPVPDTRFVNPRGSLAPLTMGGRVNKLVSGELPCQHPSQKKTPQSLNPPICYKYNAPIGGSLRSIRVYATPKNIGSLQFSSTSSQIDYHLWSIRCNSIRPRSGGDNIGCDPPPARHGMVRLGVVRHGVAWSGLVWHGEVIN